MKGVNLSPSVKFMVDEIIADMDTHDWDEWAEEISSTAGESTNFLNPPEIGKSLPEIGEEIDQTLTRLLYLVLAAKKVKPWKEVTG